MKKLIFKTIGLVVTSAAILFIANDVALAQDLNAMTGTIKNQMPGVADVLSAVAYIAGIGFGIKAALTLKEHNETKGQTKLSTPITLAIVAAMLLGLPSLLTNAKGSIFGNGTPGTTIDGSSLRSIN
jgi:hypothetical protein